MRLYILRHGPAEDHSHSGRDFDRALTASGRQRVRDVGRALHEANEAPLLILSSPLVRALQTAEIIAEVAKVAAPVDVRKDLAPGGEARALVDTVLAGKGDRVMLVGHEPDLADLASTLSGRAFPAGLQKAMVVGLGRGASPLPATAGGRDKHPLHDASAPMHLRFVLDPKSLEWHFEAPSHTR